MSYSKWIGAAIGWSFGGPIGAIIGLALGSIIDSVGINIQTYTEQPPVNTRPKTESGDFEISLLILASIVIKADGKQDQRELDFVRNQFVSMYGKERANHAFRLFKEINKQQNISPSLFSNQANDGTSIPLTTYPFFIRNCHCRWSGYR
jgi:DnaJ like chaperone protein